MPLTIAQSEAAIRYLASFFPNVAADGEKLFGSAKFEFAEDGDFIDAVVTVPGGNSFEVELMFEKGECFGECSCIYEADCVHCYAAARRLCSQTGAVPPPPKAAKTKAKSTSAKKTRSPAESKILYGEELFLAEVSAKLKREFARGEKAYLKRIFELFTRHRNSRHIAEFDFSNLLTTRVGWNYAMHQLWDTPPHSAWEAWLYFAHFLTKHGQPLPPFLAEITPPDEIAHLVSAWQRRVAAEKWRADITSFVHRSSQALRSVELRAIFEEKALQLEWRDASLPDKPFALLKGPLHSQLEREHLASRLRFDPLSRVIWNAFTNAGRRESKLAYDHAKDAARILLDNPLLAGRIFTAAREPFHKGETPLVWQVREPEDPDGDYEFRLTLPDGRMPAPALITVDGRPGYYVTADTIYETPPLGLFDGTRAEEIPAEIIETETGVALLSLVESPLPPRLAARTDDIEARVVLECSLYSTYATTSEMLRVSVSADFGPGLPTEVYEHLQWRPISSPSAKPDKERIRRVNRAPLGYVESVLSDLRLSWNAYGRSFERAVNKKFPEEFVEWVKALPLGYELRLDPTLATLSDSPLAAKVRLEVTEAAMDWFDLQVALDVVDTELTKEELDLLLAADGEFVRLGSKGWRRLTFELSEEEERALAEAGLDARDFSGEKHRLHALQLAGKSAERLLPATQAAAVRRRVEEIQTRVAPEIPPAISAELRPYQIEGYHFLAYLGTNRFGGILADDMGLGKTLQTLTWLAWLRDQPGTEKLPSLVVCPKSVVMNWETESQRFLPGLRVVVLSKGASGPEALAKARAAADLVVINYAQLRLLETELLAAPWLVAILDEAQFIKNPDSQTTRVAVQLQTRHRLALTGTPIENRLLDLWSIMNFAMPGILGSRARFNKSFDQRKDPFARMRLAARVRPFVLRRAKREVAKDLPERSEEDLLCEMEGTQAKLYRAELKRARQILLKLKTSKDLDRSRFNILTSLLRLRQICCHPALVSEKGVGEESAKLTALLDLLEPLMEEGHKVLVFSQFTGMLDLIHAPVREREWPAYLLTGATEDRQPLVAEFQAAPGAAVFLISLRAGGFGLNLTAASYVVLFDPWWNPAVENQAIDRTHRIGQVNKVNAYRIIVSHSIEEKIRNLQKQKRALAEDVLGEEAFAKTLSLDDFKFLLGDDGEE